MTDERKRDRERERETTTFVDIRVRRFPFEISRVPDPSQDLRVPFRLGRTVVDL